MPEKTIVEQLAAANASVTEVTAKLTAVQTESAAKISALEASVAALTTERDTFKAQAEKAQADLTASAKVASDLTAENATLKARLADPSFKAAATPGEQTPAPAGAPAAEQKTLAHLEAAYMNEKDETKLAALREQIFAAQVKK